LAFALTAASNLGLLFQYVLPQLPVLADLIQTLSMALFFPLLFALFGRALSVREMVPWVHRIQYLASALCIGAGVSRLFDLYSAFGGKLMMLGMLGGLGWINATAWISWKRRSRGLPTAVALSLFTTSFALAPIVALGLVPPFRYFELFWVVGSVGFIVLAQMTTLAEVRSARIQRRAADSRAAEASRLAEQEATWRQQQSVYFAGVAHDVRTPLNALSVGLRNLERSLAPVTVSVGERLDRLQSSTRRLAEMIERHLQMLRLEQPGFELILAPMPIDDCIGQVRAAVSDAWPDRPIEVVVRDGAPATSVFDGELIVRALINLLSNAAIAAPPGTPIELEVVGDGEGGVGFSVLDSGLGLVGHQLEQLVKVNWRRSRATGGKLADLTGGFGLGLPMAQIIATLHGGRIE
jgi:signal transduction histidine kinase